MYGVCLGLMKNTVQMNATDKKLGHQRIYSAALLEKQITASGLKVVSKEPTFIKFLSNAQMLDFSDAQIAGLFNLAGRLPLHLGSNLFYICR